MDPRWSLAQIFVDAVMLLGVGLSSPVVRSVRKVFVRGFFCNDEDIMHPDTGPSTIDNNVFHPTGCLLDIAVITLTEFLRQRKEDKISLWRFKVPKWWYTAYTILVSFAFGLLSSILVTTVIKGSVGRLRPYFFAGCVPNVNCSLPENHHVYHTDYECTNKHSKVAIRLSFPSGHSSFAMYCALFAVIYVQKRMTWTVSKLPKCGLQVIAIVLALYVGLSRVSDYKHHWSDVIAGFLVGGGCAVLVSLNLYWVSASLEPKSVNSVRPEPEPEVAMK